MLSGLLALMLTQAQPSPAENPRAELRITAGALWLGGTPFFHSFNESAQLDAVKHRLLPAFSADVATFDGWFGIAWFGLTWAYANNQDVTVVVKHDDEALPRHLSAAAMHLLLLKGPAPRVRLRLDRVTLFAQTTLGIRTGFIVQGQQSFSPIELFWFAAGGADVELHEGWSLGLNAELAHSLATGWPTVLPGLHLRGWL